MDTGNGVSVAITVTALVGMYLFPWIKAWIGQAKRG